MSSKAVICLMGPTASGKTEIALRLADEYPVDLISVDSALVYRCMDIGTAKPDQDTLRRYPHRLVDIRDPEDPYSAGEFVRDAAAEIDAIHQDDRIPLLVGGTMMYFRALIDGIAELPDADARIRAAIDSEAKKRGWPEMHRQLLAIDPLAAAKIEPNDSQRIQRALEVYRVSGRRLSGLQAETTPVLEDVTYIKVALIPEPRSVLHARIEQRLDQMVEQGVLDEVRTLMRRPALTADCSSMRAVGYRQFWKHLAGEWDFDEARSRALAATRQLAKRQLTWLRSESDLLAVNPLESDAFSAISSHLREALALHKN